MVNVFNMWCWRECVSIIFVMEMMIVVKELEKVRNKCGFENGFCVRS